MPPVRHRDLYDVLGVARDATSDAIKKAYRKLARELHPDVNPDDAAAEERFKEVTEAYGVLSDADKRRDYDEFGDLSLQSGFDADEARRARESFRSEYGDGTRFFRDAGGEGFAMGDLGDLLGDLFGRGGMGGRGGAPFGGPPPPRRGADLEAVLDLDFKEAALGCEKPVTVTRPSADGSLRTDRVTVRIPPGVRDGGRIRLAGKGAEARGGGAPGDLFARLRVRPHPIFEVRGRDLHLEVPISVREAVHGAQVEIPTLEGRATVTVPAGTDSGTRLRLRGKGIPGARGKPAGHLYATVMIQVGTPPPEAPDAEALAALDPPDLRAKLFS